MVDEDDIAAIIPCGPKAEPILDAIASYADAGYDHLYIHQVGPDQGGFLDFATRSLLPEFARESVRSTNGWNGGHRGRDRIVDGHSRSPEASPRTVPETAGLRQSVLRASEARFTAAL